MAFFRRLLLHAIIRFVAWPKTTLGVAALILLACCALATTRLHISTDQNTLFSDKARFFHDYLEFNRQFPENDALYVIIEPVDTGIASPRLAARWMSAADRITERLQRMPNVVSSAYCRVPLEKLGAQAILYQEPAELPKTFAQLAGLARLAKEVWGEKPGLAAGIAWPTPLERFMAAMQVPLQDKVEQRQQAEFVGLLARSWNQTVDQPVGAGDKAVLPDLSLLAADDPSARGYFYRVDETDPRRHMLLVQVTPRVNYTSLTAISETVDTIRGAVAEVAKDFPEFEVGVTGRPVLAADEMSTTDRDSHEAEIVAMIVVFIGLAVVLRSIWMALAAEIALAVAIGWTFGWATIAVGELNLLSLVFLIALIGIGMDYLVQIMMAYRREARRRLRAKAIWARVFISVAPPINTACLGAAGAFLVSVITDFRGAAELGIIAGGGLLLCLAAGYTVLPALLVIFPPAIKRLDAADRYTGKAAHAQGWRRLLPVGWLIALAAGTPFMFRAGFNPNLLDLQAPKLPSVKLVRKLQTWSAVVLSKDLNELRLVRQAVVGSPYVRGTDSVLRAYDNAQWLAEHHSQLPKIEWAEPAPVQPDRLDALASETHALASHFMGIDAAAAGELNGFAKAVAASSNAALTAARLSAWQSGFVGQLREAIAVLSPPAPDPAALPVEMRQHWMSMDDGHSPVYALYITPTDDLWGKRENLESFEKDVENRVAGVAPNLAVTGITSDIYHSTSSIERSFYITTAISLGLIFLLVLMDLRSISQTLLAISVLGLGLPMLLALMGVFKIQWNFANFFGLPILIGAGHEYGVFMVHRYREARRDPRRAWRRWDASDRALALCAFVTSSSFGFFWALGHHRGLRSLGLVMAMGTACIYLSALLVLRPLLLRRLARRGVVFSQTDSGTDRC